MPRSAVPLSLAVLFWGAATASFFVFEGKDYGVPPIAEDALASVLLSYVPVLVFAVFLLLFLTRNRSQIDWSTHYSVDKGNAARQAWQAVIYLLATQFVLGFLLKIGLHFPGPFVYETGSHNQGDVWTWAVIYSVAYVVLPLVWLNRNGFSLFRLIKSLNWRRDIWIILAYWAMDFFGPIFAGADFFGLTASQYAQGVPVGIFVNTLGAGLPVVFMMHIILIPRLSVLFESKFTVIVLAGLFYAMFSLFDQGVDYSSLDTALMSVTYIIMTQTLVGMGKATFTVVTGNPFIHFVTLHVLSARVPFDTKMYTEIFKLK